MAKNKKPRVPNHNHHDGPKQRGGNAASTGGRKAGKKKMASFSKLNTSTSKGKAKVGQKKNQQHQQKQHNEPIVPFNASDRILLVGEGDFSFAQSLAIQHGCKRVLATSYDSEQTVHEKYPQAKENIDLLIAAGRTPSKSLKRKREDDDGDSHPSSENESSEEWNGIADSTENEASDDEIESHDERQKGEDNHVTPSSLTDHSQSPKVLFSVDAKKLGAGVVGGGKEIRNGFPRPGTQSRSRPQGIGRRPLPSQESIAPTKGIKGGESRAAKSGPWDIICFNFPHVGGLSTDVNRQVRSNQELLVSFFKACVPLLSAPDHSLGDGSDAFMSSYQDDNFSEDGSGCDEEENSQGKPHSSPRTEPGQIIVTIFEGEPYTLWNIRDLARHTGLRVVRSFKFPWSSYPGYRHARTLGQIEAKDGSGRGGWKGEEREARTFIFEIENDDSSSTNKPSQKRKGDGGDSSDG